MVLLQSVTLTKIIDVFMPTILTALAAAAITWFFTRKTKAEELRTLELKNTAAIIEQEQKNSAYWQKQAAQDREQVEKLLGELLHERQLRKTYENEVTQMRIEISELKAEVNALRTTYETNSK